MGQLFFAEFKYYSSCSRKKYCNNCYTIFGCQCFDEWWGARTITKHRSCDTFLVWNFRASIDIIFQIRETTVSTLLIRKQTILLNILHYFYQIASSVRESVRQDCIKNFFQDGKVEGHHCNKEHYD